MQHLEFKRGVVLIDDEDMWVTDKYYLRAEVRRSDGYQSVSVESKDTRRKSTLGRVLLGIIDPNLQADHINNDGFDNRRENLRVVDKDLQNANRRFNNPHGYKGVVMAARHSLVPYRGRLKRHGVPYYGPYRSSPEQAGLDYNRMAIALWGRQVVLNDVRCIAIEPKRAEHHCMFCNALCHCCCVCFDPPSPGMQRLFDSLEAS